MHLVCKAGRDVSVELLQLAVAVAVTVSSISSTNTALDAAAERATLLLQSSLADVLNDSLESVLAVGVVLHDTGRTVRLIQRVLALHHITVAHLPLALVITGVVVLNSVLELVLRVGIVVLTLVAALAATSDATFQTTLLIIE